MLKIRPYSHYPRVCFRFSEQVRGKTPYTTLGLDSKCSQQEIKAKYYELAQQFHPDKNPENVEKFKEISEAYKILKDSQRRQELDEELTHGPMKSGKTVYSSEYHYGQTPKSKAHERPKHKYESPYRANVGSYFDQSSSLFKNKKQSRASESQRTIKTVLTVFAVLGGVIGLVEMIFKVYEFNHSRSGKAGSEKRVRLKKTELIL